MTTDYLIWNSGRLCGNLDGKTVSMSISEAYHKIPEDSRIADACKDVLRPYDKNKDKLIEE